jgi:sialic acid synthase SpsE
MGEMLQRRVYRFRPKRRVRVATKFISEVSSNHHADLERCLAFVDASAAFGADAVKFQLFKIRELFAPEVVAKSQEHRRRIDWELPVAFLPALAKRCQELGVEFSCTPFYLDAVAELEPYVDFYKIASYELTWDALLEACAKTGKPVILSTGMATMPEIEHAVGVLRAAGVSELTLLHCVSGYPAPVDECNLAAIGTIRDAFQCEVGWSDHTVQPSVVHRAVSRWGASTVEFHLDLDGEGEEFGAGHCWLPDQIGRVISEIRAGEIADGSELKQPTAAELPDRDWRADPSDGLRPFLHVREEWR